MQKRRQYEDGDRHRSDVATSQRSWHLSEARTGKEGVLP